MWENQSHSFRVDDSLFVNSFLYAPIGKTLITSTGKLIKVNPSYCHFIGYTEEELLLSDYESFTHPDDLELSIDKMKKLVKGEVPYYQIEKRYIHKNGHVIWGLLSCSAIPKSGSDPILIAQIIDITERKMMENQLIESEHRYRLTVETPIKIVTRHDIKGNYLYVSPSCYDITGYHAHELVGHSLDKIVHSEDKEKLKEQFHKIVELDIIQPFSYRFVKKDGTIGWCESTGRTIPDMNTGMIKEVVVVTKDITNQMELTTQLQKTEELFQVISQHSKDLISIADHDGITRYISPAITPLLGYESHEVLDRPATDFLHPEDIVTVTSDEGIFECRARHKDGHYVPFETSIKMVRNDDGDIERIVGIARDITVRKQAEHYMVMSEKLTVLSQLAAGVAHEIRNPLTAIKGFIRLLTDKIPEETYYFGIIIDEIARVDLILSELLLLSKSKRSEWEKNNMESILRQVVTLLRSQAILQNIDIIELYDDSPLEVWCDENSLKQVFINLIKNAIEAMPDGGNIYLSMKRENEAAVIRIVDQGCGIPQDRLHKIGTPFYTTKKNGTGLGMMITYNIIDNHNGKIRIKSEVNKGTTFVIHLPLNSEKETLE